MSNYCATIETIRHMKNVPTKVLIHNIISQSSYSRCKLGKAELTARQLVSLINRLSITQNEFWFIHEKDCTTSFTYLQDKLVHAFPQQDLKTIREVMLTAQEQYTATESPQFHHLAILANLYLARLQQRPFNALQEAGIDELMTYLSQLDMWTHHDSVLFNNASFAFPVGLRDFYATNLDKSFRTYKNYFKNQQEYVSFIANRIVFALTEQETPNIAAFVSTLQSIKLTPNMIKERLMVSFFVGIQTYLTNEDHPQEPCQHILDIAKEVEPTQLYPLLANVMSFVIQHNSHPASATVQ